MHRTKAMASVCFCAGMLGALCSSLAAWVGGNLGLAQTAWLNMPPQWNLPWLYPRLFCGGLWGLAFFITVASPRARNRWVRKGLWVSLLPTAWQLFYVFPNQTTHGALGLGLGILTPLLVIGFNFIWGFFTGFFGRLLWGRP
ncbi:MAG: hypothetical protein R2864_08265 [Syntrophotaleaceae bacterium]